MKAGRDTKEYRRLARDGAFNYVGQLLAAVIGLAMIPVLLEQLGAERYGVLVVAVTCALLAAFLDLGLGTAVTRDVASGDLAGERFVRSAGPAFLVVGVAGCVLLAGLGAAVHAGGFARGVPEVPAVFALIGLGFCADQLTVYHTAVLGGVRRFDAVSALLVGNVALRAAGTLAVLSVGGGTSAVAGWYATTAWLVAGANALAVRTLTPRHAFTVARLDAQALRSRLSYGSGSLAIMVSLGALWNAGPLIVAAISGAAASALFAVSQRFPMGALALPERISVVLFPAAGQPGASAAWLVVRGTRLTMTVLLPVAIVLLVSAGAILEAWLEAVPDDGPLVLRLTTLAVLAYGVCAGAVQVTWAGDDVRRLAVALAASAALASAGGAALVVALGPVGAAWGLVAGTVTAAGWTLTLAAAAAGGRARDLLSEALRDFVAPAAACAAAAGGVAALELGEGWLRVFVIAAAALTAYALAIAMRRESASWLGHRFPRLRSAGYLLLALRAALGDSRRRSATNATAPYEEGPDPWRYTTAWGDRHLELAEQLLDAVSARCAAALDVGCGEGWMTERIARRCGEVLAVDISDTALRRARERCAHARNVDFRRWDLLRDPTLGQFDLVLAMGVLEVFLRPSTMRRARRRILEMTAPGGYLLVTTTKQSLVVEQARWSSRLVRGSRAIDRFLCDSGELRRCATEESATHVLTVYQRTGES